MIKLIVSDMDGTLLDDNKILHNEFWEVFNTLREKGIFFVPASGRQYFNIYEYFKRVKENLIILAENGSYVVEDGKEIYSKPLAKEAVKDIINTVRNIPTANVVFCGKKKAYVENDSEEFINELKKYYTKYEIVDDVLKVDDEALKITICDITGAEKNTHPYLAKYTKDFKVCVSGYIWVDVTDKNINKGIALKALQKKLGVTENETMVFGDYLNDCELIKGGKYSFAMENAHPELKKLAKYCGGSNNKNGVINTIKKYILK